MANGLFEKMPEIHRERLFQKMAERIEWAIKNNEKIQWKSFLKIFGQLHNARYGTEYKGFVNNFILSMVSMSCGGDPRFVTPNAVHKLHRNGAIVKDAPWTPIWKPIPIFFPDKKECARRGIDPKTAPKGSVPMVSIVKDFSPIFVVNIRQTNLIELGVFPDKWAESVNKDSAPIEIVEEFCGKIDYQEALSAGHPAYSPRADKVLLPLFDQFENKEAFAHAKIHELVHWTGHESRLNRKGITETGLEVYSKEELVAELGTVFLLHHLGVDLDTVHIENDTAYLRGWLSRLKDDMEILFEAAAEAGSAVDYLIAEANGLHKEKKAVAA